MSKLLDQISEDRYPELYELLIDLLLKSPHTLKAPSGLIGRLLKLAQEGQESSPEGLEVLFEMARVAEPERLREQLQDKGFGELAV